MNLSSNRSSTLKRCCCVAGFALSMLLALPALGNEIIYTWTDDDGVRHYSAQPPEGREYRIVETLSSAVPGTPRQSEPESPPRPATLPEIAEGVPDPEVVRERCEQARQNLDLLQQDRPAVLRQEEGEPTPLDDTQRQEMIEQTEDFIAEWC